MTRLEPSLRTRLATTADLPAIAEVMTAAIGELQRAHLDEAQIEASRAIMGVDRTLVEDGTYLVVEADGALAGCGGWSARATAYGGDHTPGRDDSLLDPTTDGARVRAMYTAPRFARRGVGRSILVGCQRHAAARGFRRLELVATLAGQPLYRSFGFEADETFDDDAGGVAVPLARMSKVVPAEADPIGSYRALFTRDPEAIPAAAADFLDEDMVFESARLGRVLVGRPAVVERVLAIAAAVADQPIEQTTGIQWAGSTAHWYWSVGNDPATADRGMDVATLAGDGRLARLAVFGGQTPPEPAEATG